jgi:hypothetical protein
MMKRESQHRPQRRRRRRRRRIEIARVKKPSEDTKEWSVLSRPKIIK